MRADHKYRRYTYAHFARILAAFSDERSVSEFSKRLMYAALTGNADMHAKNWSLIYRDGRNPGAIARVRSALHDAPHPRRNDGAEAGISLGVERSDPRRLRRRGKRSPHRPRPLRARGSRNGRKIPGHLAGSVEIAARTRRGEIRDPNPTDDRPRDYRGTGATPATRRSRAGSGTCWSR